MNYSKLIKLYLWLYRRWEKRPGYWTERKLKKVMAMIKHLDKVNKARRVGNYE